MSGFGFIGSGVALVTPFTQDGVDTALLERLIDRQIEAGTDALVVLGTTGEPCTMTEDEARTAIRCCAQRAQGRVPVIAGAGGNDTRAVIERCAMAADAGADALLVVTPYYNRATQGGLIAHYEAIADRALCPVILYNVPSRTGVNMLPETVAHLARHPRICGLKEAAADIVQLAEAVRLCEGRLRVYAGNDASALAALAVGAQGAISVSANIAPALMKRMTSAWFRGECDRALIVQQALAPLHAALFTEVNPIPVKAALRMMGYGDGRLRLPLTDLTEPSARKLYAVLRDLLLI